MIAVRVHGGLLSHSLRRPRMPCGRTSSTRISTISARHRLQLGRHAEQGRHLDHQPDDEPADERAVGADPRPPSVMPANIRNSRTVPMSEADLLVEPAEDAAERGEGAGGDPDDADHLRRVDARRRGEVDVVADRACRLAEPRVLQRRAPRRPARSSESSDRDQVAGRDARPARSPCRPGWCSRSSGRSRPPNRNRKKFLQHDRQADGDDHLRDQADAALAQLGEAPPVERRTRADPPATTAIGAATQDVACPASR